LERAKANNAAVDFERGGVSTLKRRTSREAIPVRERQRLPRVEHSKGQWWAVSTNICR